MTTTAIGLTRRRAKQCRCISGSRRCGLMDDNNHVYVWNAMKRTHYQFQRDTGIVEEKNSRFAVPVDGYFMQFALDSQLPEKVKAIKAVFKKPTNPSGPDTPRVRQRQTRSRGAAAMQAAACKPAVKAAAGEIPSKWWASVPPACTMDRTPTLACRTVRPCQWFVMWDQTSRRWRRT